MVGLKTQPADKRQRVAGQNLLEHWTFHRLVRRSLLELLVFFNEKCYYTGRSAFELGSFIA